MAKMIVVHKVEDFDTWKPVFDSLDAVRRESGCTDIRIYRASDSPNDLVIISQWENHGQAKEWSQSPEMKEALQKSGTQGTPKIYFVD